MGFVFDSIRHCNIDEFGEQQIKYIETWTNSNHVPWQESEGYLILYTLMNKKPNLGTDEIKIQIRPYKDTEGNDAWLLPIMSKYSGSAYRNCLRDSNVTKIDFSHFKVGNNDDWSDAFNSYELAEIVGYQNLDFSNVASIASLFDGTRISGEVDLSGWKTSNKLRIPGALFRNNADIEGVDVSNWDVTNVTYIWEMFLGCTNLKYAKCRNWALGPESDCDMMFEGCESLEYIDVKGCTEYSIDKLLTSINNSKSAGHHWWYNYYTERIEPISIFGTTIDGSAPTLLIDGEEHTATADGLNWSLILPGEGPWDFNELIAGNEVVDSIEFADIDIPQSDEEYYEYMMYGYFIGCFELKSIKFNRLNLTGNKMLFFTEQLFSQLPALEYADISKWYFGDSFYILDYAFMQCPELVEVHLPDLPIVHRDFGGAPAIDSLFYECPKLKTVTLPKFSSCSGFTANFSGCTELKDISFFNNINFVNDYQDSTRLTDLFSRSGVETVDIDFRNVPIQQMDYIFGSCPNLKKITLRNCNFSKFDGYPAFFTNCPNLESFEFVGGNFDGGTFNGYNLLTSCPKIKNADFSMFKGMKWYCYPVIPYNSFDGCVALETLDLSGHQWQNFSGSPSIGNIFKNCNNLKWIKIAGANDECINSCVESCTAAHAGGYDSWGRLGDYIKPLAIKGTTYDGSLPTVKINGSSVTVTADSKVSDGWIATLPGTITSLEEFLQHQWAVNSVSFNADLSNVTSIREMFSWVNSNEFEVSFEGLDLSNVTDAYEAFYQSSITKISLANCGLSKLENAMEMFANCERLTYLDLSGTDFSSVWDTYGMFEYSNSLSKVKVAGCNEATKTRLLDQLRSDLGSGWYLDGDYFIRPSVKGTFRSNPPSDVYINGEYLTPSVDYGSYTWSVSPNSSQITSLESFLHNNEVDTFDFTGFDLSLLTNVSEAFAYSTIMNVDFVSGFIATYSSQLTNMGHLFQNARADSWEPVQLDVSSWNTSNNEHFNQMFEQCEIDVVGVEHLDSSKATSSESMFNQVGWGSINCANKNWIKNKNFNVMFYGTSNLYDLDCSNWTNAGVASGCSHEMMFSGSGVQQVKITGSDSQSINFLITCLNEVSAGGSSSWHQDGDYLVP